MKSKPWKFVLFVFQPLCHNLYVSGQNARINAPAQFILNTERIQIECQPAGSMHVQINALSILKNNRPMVSVGKLNGQISIAWSDSSVQSRARTNAPNLDNVSTAQLRVTIEANNTQCDDQAKYTCRVNALDASFNVVPNNEVSANVSVVVKPDRMDEMTVSPLPPAAGHYSEGQNITISCTGTVGSYADPPRIAWCIQRNGDFSPSDLESDSYFRSITQSKAQAVGSGPTTSCQYQRTSTVVYEVSNIDTDTTFWCQITAPGDSPICGKGTVRQQKTIEVAQTTMSTGSKNEAQTTMSIGSTVEAQTTMSTGSKNEAQTTMSIGSTVEVQTTMTSGSVDKAQSTVTSGSGLQRDGGIVIKWSFCFLFLIHFIGFML